MDTDSLELWGGVECTVNRVGDRFFDQMERNGHAWREDDLDRFAALGIISLRYPVLWERLAPDRPVVADWSWTDRRLGRLRELGIRPVLGLVHHGSGPRRTNLLDPGFPEGLADFARQVAERYPWIEDYTPVNEPLTTARFSALYGHWYPHARDDASFARAFLHQCQAVVLAMRAIRAVNPAARLLQTEDLGKTYSTPAMADLAEFENHRRWLTFDLLGGHLDPKHPMWAYLKNAGVRERELGWFLDAPCPPDVLGINHYVTSERFLDERPERYPAYARAGNDARPYADMPAVRASAQGVSGPGRLLREAWERYRLPLVVTEAQLNCTREEQMRWFAEIWRDARTLRAQEGVDVRAVTLWALLGAFNWINLLTRDDPDSYEPGAFDVRAPVPRPTALASLARTLAAAGDSNHPALDAPGWWRRPGRFACEPVQPQQPLTPPVNRLGPTAAPGAPLLIVGAGRALAHAFEVVSRERTLPTRALDAGRWASEGAGAIPHLLDDLRPWAVIDASDGPADFRRRLAAECAERGLTLLGFTGDGYATDPEEAGPTLLVQTGLRFGPWDAGDAVWGALQARPTRLPEVLPAHEPFSLTYLPDLVHGCLDLLLDGETGCWHLANHGILDLATFLVQAGQAADGKLPTSAPPWSPLPPTRFQTLPLPSWQSALKQLLDSRLPARQ